MDLLKAIFVLASLNLAAIAVMSVMQPARPAPAPATTTVTNYVTIVREQQLPPDSLDDLFAKSTSAFATPRFCNSPAQFRR